MAINTTNLNGWKKWIIISVASMFLGGFGWMFCEVRDAPKVLAHYPTKIEVSAQIRELREAQARTSIALEHRLDRMENKIDRILLNGRNRSND